MMEAYTANALWSDFAVRYGICGVWLHIPLTDLLGLLQYAYSERRLSKGWCEWRHVFWCNSSVRFGADDFIALDVSAARGDTLASRQSWLGWRQRHYDEA